MVAPKVYLTAGGMPVDLIERIEAECEVVRREGPSESPEEFIERMVGMDGILCPAPERISGELLERCSGRLRVVSNFGVGYDNIDLGLATKHGVLVCNTPGVLSDAVADLTLGLILNLARRISEADRFVRAGEWGRASFPLGWDLRGKVLGIVGAGRIGRAVAERAAPFGMQVIACDVIDCSPYEACDLDVLMQRADVVSIHTNLTLETRGLIGGRELGLMKPAAVLINTARGPIVDWDALRAALVEGRIAGAGLDVYEFEPEVPAGLKALENVTLLPHLGTACLEVREAMGMMAVANLTTFADGQEPPNLLVP